MGNNPTVLSADFTGNDGHTYTFRVRAYDTAGNEGAWSAQVTTIIDISAPESQASAPATSQSAEFIVTWSGEDYSPPSGQPSGLASYDVQYRDGNSDWIDWLEATTVTTATFTGEAGHMYRFRVRARDTAGNVEAWPSQPDASTEVIRTVTKYYYHPSTGSGQAGGKRVAMRRSTASGSVVYYLHGDHPSTGSGQAWARRA